MVFSSRSAAWACTAGETPWAENTTVCALRHLVELLDEDRAARLQVGDDVLVVDDLLADVDGRAVEVERLLDGDDRTVDAGAVAARAPRSRHRGCPATSAGCPGRWCHGARV